LYRRDADLTADAKKCPPLIWDHLHSKAGRHDVSVPLIGGMVPQLRQSGPTALLAFKNFDPMNRSHRTICNRASAGSVKTGRPFQPFRNGRSLGALIMAPVIVAHDLAHWNDGPSF
jgi:hypothetical protein